MIPAQLLEQLTAILTRARNVECVYLFGSAARGTTPEPRDLDLAVCFTEPPKGDRRTSAGERATQIQVALERELGVPVDVHAFEDLPLDLRFRVLDEGRLLIDRAPSERLAREVLVMEMYWDFRPYLDRILEASRRRLADQFPLHG